MKAKHVTFFQTDSNSGFIKVNYISDDLRAEVINEAARSGPRPVLVSSPALSGGYRFPILEDIADGAIFQILKADLPRNDKARKQQLHELFKAPETLYTYADESDVTIVQIEGWNRKEIPLSSLGWQIVNGPKTFKRLKTLNRPFRLGTRFHRPLRVHIVEDDSYTNEDLSVYSPGEIERLLDGAFVISRELFEACLEDVVFPTLDLEENPEFEVDFYKAEEYFRQAQYFHAFNARIFGPMVFSGIEQDDPLHGQIQSLKGEAFLNVSDTCERMHVDIICTRSALKFEVGNDSRNFILLEPQKAKRSGVNSDFQTITNLPGIYSPKFVKEWISEFLYANFNRLKNNQVMEEWFSMAVPYFNAGSRVFAQNDVSTLTKWNARAWLMSGRRITESPWIFEQLASAIAKHIKSNDESRLRFPVPCAVRAQVISQSFASMAGCDLIIPEGAARWSDELESIVVNDVDWIEMYLSHGGHDLDDFFVGYYRTFGNLRKIVLVRSPNDWGEYSVFDYVEGDWFPVFEKHDGSFMLFPEVDTNPELWPKRLSEAVRDGDVVYTGLPSENEEKVFDPHPYSPADVLALIENNKASAGSVGINVNARSLHALCMKSHRPVQLTSMEACIDAGTQGGSAADAEAVTIEAKEIVDIIINGNCKVDSYVWNSRFGVAYRGVPFDKRRLTDDTHVSRANRYRNEAAREFRKMARDHAQENFAQNVDPLVHALGKRMLRDGYQVLIDTRLAMVQMQTPGEQSLAVRDWRDIHSLMLEKIQMFENEIDRHDFVLAVYSACFRVPTRSTGRVSDQLVMNPHIFPYLMAAMRFYGLAYHIAVDENGKIVRTMTDSWTLECSGCDSQFVVSNPVTVQSYYHHGGLCKSCRTSVTDTEDDTPLDQEQTATD